MIQDWNPRARYGLPDAGIYATGPVVAQCCPESRALYDGHWHHTPQAINGALPAEETPAVGGGSHWQHGSHHPRACLTCDQVAPGAFRLASIGNLDKKAR